MNEIQIRSCGFLIFRTGTEPSPDQFLLMKHKDRWDLPKGHVDPGETQMECALRELHEETGIRDSDISIDPGYRYCHQYEVRYARNHGRPQQKELVIFLAKLIRPVEIVVTEHLGHQWMDWAPPHAIQEQTIDPVLSLAAHYWPQRN